MPSLTSTCDFLRPLNPGGFCYLCGDSLKNSPVDKQHVVPKKLFRVDHRNPLLILKVHKSCNGEQSVDDEEISQLVGVLWRGDAQKEAHFGRLGSKYTEHQTSAGAVGVIADFSLRDLLVRWIQGFHAALYGEFLSLKTDFRMVEPLPGGDSPYEQFAIPVWAYSYAKFLRTARDLKRVDAIEIPNGKLLYHCSWSDEGEGNDLCVFGLDLYNWSELGSGAGLEKRFCVGAYKSKRPRNSSGPDFRQDVFDGRCSLDPFEGHVPYPRQAPL